MGKLRSHWPSQDIERLEVVSLQNQILIDTLELRIRIKKCVGLRRKMLALYKELDVYTDADELTPADLVKMRKIQKKIQVLSRVLQELKIGDPVQLNTENALALM